MKHARSFIRFAVTTAVFSLHLGYAPGISAEGGAMVFASARGRVPPYGFAALMEDAASRLATQSCAMVLSDFKDYRGHLLSEKLETLGLSAPQFFGRLKFYDGSAVPLCRRRDVAAVSEPGVPSVAICMETFGALTRKHRGFAADVLIHEMLHTLGLAENPPTAEEITNQVIRRCGM